MSCDCKCKQENRLGKIESDIGNLYNKVNPLEINFAKLTTMFEYLKQKVDRIEKMVEQLAEQPAKRWDGLVEKVISVAAGSIATAVVAAILYAMSSMSK